VDKLSKHNRWKYHRWKRSKVVVLKRNGWEVYVCCHSREQHVILINTTALHDVFCFLHAICKANFPDDVGLQKDSPTFIIFSNAVVSVVFS